MRDPTTIATFFIFIFSFPKTTEKSHGQRSLEGYNPKGHKELDMAKRPSTHTHRDSYSENSQGHHSPLDEVSKFLIALIKMNFSEIS